MLVTISFLLSVNEVGGTWLDLNITEGFHSQADAVLVDGSGRHHPVHSGLLRLLFPVFRGINIEEIRVVVLDRVSNPEAELLIELAYGMGRFAKLIFYKG